MARPRKAWSLQIGSYGARVTLYERRAAGPLWLRWWSPATSASPGRWCYRALGHSDRIAGEQAAREVAAQLLASTLAAEQGRATVADVFAAYERDVAAHLKGAGPREAKRRASIWTAFLGATRDVATIDFPTCDRYVRERRAGRITVDGYKLGPKVTDRAIEADVVYLRAALNHATKVLRPNGRRLLEANPIQGYEPPRNKNPKRPVVSFDRFEKVLAKANGVDPQRLFGAFMQLVEGLGWRVSAICALRACDVDRQKAPASPHGRIFKSPASDKEGAGGWIPMSPDVRSAIDRILATNPAIGEWPLFPAPRARVATDRGEIPKPWTRYHARALLERAELAAKLPPVDGGDFHPYRRKWATERKHLSPQDVAAAGAWRDLRALQTAYQQTDEATLLAVVSSPQKLRDVVPDPGKAEGA